MIAHVCVEETRGSCKPLERKIGNNLSVRVKSKYLQGFILHWEREASGVGQCVCGRAEEHGGAWLVIRQTEVN